MDKQLKVARLILMKPILQVSILGLMDKQLKGFYFFLEKIAYRCFNPWFDG
jgi:hypothetical protein